jgi:hypothetical protein
LRKARLTYPAQEGGENMEILKDFRVLVAILVVSLIVGVLIFISIFLPKFSTPQAQSALATPASQPAKVTPLTPTPTRAPKQAASITAPSTLTPPWNQAVFAEKQPKSGWCNFQSVAVFLGRKNEKAWVPPGWQNPNGGAFKCDPYGSGNPIPLP